MTKYYGDNPTFLGPDGNSLDFELDFPVSVYSTDEIEQVADDVEGNRKRKLLDEFRGEDIRELKAACDGIIGDLKHNANQMLLSDAEGESLQEDVRHLPELEHTLSELGKATESGTTDEFKREQGLYLLRKKEGEQIDRLLEALKETCDSIESGHRAISGMKQEIRPLEDCTQENASLIAESERTATDLLNAVENGLMQSIEDLRGSINQVEQIRNQLQQRHRAQQTRYDRLREEHGEISSKLREKEKTDQLIETVRAKSERLKDITAHLSQLREARTALVADLKDVRARISALRRLVADEVTASSIEDPDHGHPTVKVEIVENGDRAEFKSLLSSKLQGSRLRYGQIVESISEACLPFEFAEMVRRNMVSEICSLAEIEETRAQSLVEYLRLQIPFTSSRLHHSMTRCISI